MGRRSFGLAAQRHPSSCPRPPRQHVSLACKKAAVPCERDNPPFPPDRSLAAGYVAAAGALGGPAGGCSLFFSRMVLDTMMYCVPGQFFLLPLHFPIIINRQSEASAAWQSDFGQPLPRDGYRLRDFCITYEFMFFFNLTPFCGRICMFIC